MKLTYLHLGRYESADQIAAARWFGQQPFVSADRIGIWGWSYGGDKKAPPPGLGGGGVKGALPAAPAPDRGVYDNIYSHRSIRPPPREPPGGRQSAPPPPHHN